MTRVSNRKKRFLGLLTAVSMVAGLFVLGGAPTASAAPEPGDVYVLTSFGFGDVIRVSGSTGAQTNLGTVTDAFSIDVATDGHPLVGTINGAIIRVDADSGKQETVFDGFPGDDNREADGIATLSSSLVNLVDGVGDDLYVVNIALNTANLLNDTIPSTNAVASGSAFVLDDTNDEVVFVNDGGVASTLAAGGFLAGNVLGGIASTPNSVFVLDKTNRLIIEINSTTGQQSLFATLPAGNIGYGGLDADAGGNLYTIDFTADNVVKVSRDGTVSILNTQTIPDISAANDGIAVDSRSATPDPDDTPEPNVPPAFTTCPDQVSAPIFPPGNTTTVSLAASGDPTPSLNSSGPGSFTDHGDGTGSLSFDPNLGDWIMNKIAGGETQTTTATNTESTATCTTSVNYVLFDGSPFGE